jgi:hypothetical protein
MTIWMLRKNAIVLPRNIIGSRRTPKVVDSPGYLVLLELELEWPLELALALPQLLGKLLPLAEGANL